MIVSNDIGNSWILSYIKSSVDYVYMLDVPYTEIRINYYYYYYYYYYFDAVTEHVYYLKSFAVTNIVLKSPFTQYDLRLWFVSAYNMQIQRNIPK